MNFRMKRIFLLCAFLLLPQLISAAVDIGERDFQRAQESYSTLMKSPRERLRRDKWQQVVSRFTRVAETYPRHRRAVESLFQAGKASQDLYAISRRPEDAEQAGKYFDRVAETYPDATFAIDALLLAATIEEEIKNDPAQAYLRYRSVTERYPGNEKAAVARRKVKDLARYAPPVSPARSELTGIRFWSNPGYTRVVLDLSGPTDYTANFLAGDPANNIVPRLYVDLRGAVPAAGLGETPVQDGLLRQIRAGRYDDETVRVVLDLVSIKDYKVFPLNDPMRLVLDITGDRPAELTAQKPEIAARRSEPEKVASSLNTPAEHPLKVTIPPVKGGSSLRRIVVDAGHGGKDPGAIGPSGILEKDIVLKMAHVLADRLKKEIGCDVILTRSGDVFLPLEERTAIANRVGADLFISMHVNAAPNKSAYGVETYYLNFSKNDKAAAVAARENGTSLKQIGDLELILFDLMANSKINESSRLAAEIQSSLVEDLGRDYSQVRDLGVRQGPFYVLLGATMPSVLVEAAFISHPREEARLLEKKYHERTASAIVRAVQQYANSQRMVAGQ